MLHSHAKLFPEKENEFREALCCFLGESFLHGGVHGASMITSFPESDSREIGILRTFSDKAECDAFYESQLFKDWARLVLFISVAVLRVLQSRWKKY